MISYFTGEIKMARTLRWFPKMVLAQCCPCLHSCLHADSQRGLRLFLKNTTNWGCGRYPESPWLACRLLSSENSPILPTQLPCWRLPTQLHTGATTPAELTVKIPKALWLQLTTPYRAPRLLQSCQHPGANMHFPLNLENCKIIKCCSIMG